MYDCLTEELCKELGQLDPDWFQVLTTRASSKEGNLSDSDDQEELCPNQEANFKTPLRKTAAADVTQSQHSSIPRVFRRSYVPSPDNDDQQEIEPLPWDTRSPCLFGLAKDAVPHSDYGYARPRTPNWFDLLHTPQVSPASYAQHICESLGADIHPDISWTSSLNTPPALPSTLIISKTIESPSPKTFCMGKSAVLVRKLFPSLSNDSRQGVASPQSNDSLEVLQDSDFPEAGPHPTLQKSPRRSPEQSNGTRRQPLPEAIRSPTPSVPDGTENSPPMILTNSSSVLRQVKSERTRRMEEKEHGSSPSDVSIESELAFSEQRESDQALCRNPPVETEDSELTPWSPLPLSEIPATTVATQVEDKCPTQAESPVKASLKCAGFTQKKTAFIYTIDKEKHSLKNNSVQGHKLPVTQMSKANDGAGVCNVGDGKDELQQREAVAKEKLPSLLRVNTKDLEMSQLCRAFAQDLSQMSYPGAPPQVGPPSPPPPPCGFSPFACLTALRVARQKAKRQVGPLGEVHLDAPAPSDSGFLSADADVSHVTAACAEKQELRHRRTFESTPTKQHEMCLQEVLPGTWTDTKDTAQPRGSFKDSTHPLVSLQSNGCERTQEIVNVSLPSIQVSGFKTTSNQSMQIPAAEPQKDEQPFDMCDAQRQPMKSVPGKETPTTSDSALSRPGSLSEKCMWKNRDENGREREETLQGFDGSFQQVQIVPKSPANVSTGTCQADGAISCDRDPKEEIPAGSSSHPSRPPKASQNNLPFDSYDINESIQGFLDMCDAQRQPMKSVPGKETPTTSDSALSRPGSLSEKCMWKNRDENGREREETLQGFDGSFQQVQIVPKSPANVSTGTYQADGAISCDRDPKEEIPAGSSSPPSCPPKASQNNLPFDSYDINESIHGSSSFVKPVQDATKSPGNANAVAHQVDQAFECARDATEEIPAASASASCAQNCDRSNCQLTASQKADVKALCTLLEEAGSQFDFTQFRTVKLKQPGKEASAPSSKADKDLEPHLLSGIDFEDSFCAEPNEKTTSTSCGTTHLEESGVARQPLCAHTTEKEERAEESLVRVSKKCLKKTKHLFQVLEASTPAQKQSVENDRSTMRTSRNEQQFVDGYDREEPLQGFFSSAIPDQSAPKGSGNMLASARQEGFRMASGKSLLLSPRAMQKAHFVFKDCAAENGPRLVETEPLMNVAASPTLVSSVGGCSSSSTAFCTDGGKRESVSSEALAKQRSFSGIKHVDHSLGGSQFAGGKQVSSAAPKKTESLLDVCHEVEEHPVCDQAFGKSDFPLTSGKPRSFSANDPFDKLGSTSKSLSVSGGKTNDGERGNAANVQATDGQLDPVENEKPEHQNSENSASSWLELDFSTWTGGGFSAAGGENASASAVALTKAKPLLQEDRGAHPSAEFKNGTSSLLEGVDHQPGGFRTAKGKRVAVSSAALKKAQLLLDDCSEVKEHPLCYPTATKSELPSASEKPGSFSDNSLFADDSLFDNLDCTPESPSVSDVKDAKTANATIVDNIDCPNDQVENGQCDNNVANCANPSLDIGSSSLLSVGGFSTASGNKVYVSAAALKKAKDLLQEDAGDALSSKMQHRSFLGVERADLAAASQNVTASSAALPTIKFLLDEDLAVEEHPGCSPPLGKSEFLSAREKPASFAAKSDLGSTLESPALTPHDSKRGNSTSKETLGGCFPIAGVTPKKASLPHKATLEADAHFKGMMDSHDGTSGKENPSIVGATAFTVKTDAQNGPLPNGNIRLHRDEEKPGNPSLDVACSSLSGARFSAASGSALPVSAAAMAAAKHFFQEDHEDDPSAKMKPGGSSGVDRLDCQAGGFQTAGGKRVTVSSAALPVSAAAMAAAKHFFQEDHEDDPSAKMKPGGSSGVDRLDCQAGGFQTAGGKRVTVSSAALKRAKFLLDDCDSVEDHPDDYPLARKSEFLSASEKPGSFSAKSHFGDLGSTSDMMAAGDGMSDVRVSKNIPKIQLGNKSAAPFGDDKNTRHYKNLANSAVSSSAICSSSPSGSRFSTASGRSLSVSDEAVIRAKSLFNDLEGENQKLHRNASLQHAKRDGPQNVGLQTADGGRASIASAALKKSKSFFAESHESTRQPPSKRRLLEEFDRSLDSPRGSNLCPQTSSPKGLLKDRPVFKYNVSLGPNITKPSSKNKQPAGLTLPFFKKTEARPRRSDITTPPAFVPPFKRQRTVVEQDSTKLFSKKTEDPPTTASDQSMTIPFCGRIPPTDTSWGQGTPLANVELARDMQDMRIRKKTRQTVRPLPGSLFRAKTSGATRIHLKDAVARRPPAKYTQKQLYEYGVHRHVCNITSETAEAFRFRLELFFKKDALTDESGIQLADGGRLIPSKDGTAGKEQFCRALCDTPGVDPKLLADEWVYNHYRWIVWKLASMERSFPQTMGGRCLTPERVLLQLKYRYDVEVDHSRRPALRKIMEKDDAAAKTLVLCICGVVSQDQVANPCAVVWLTDGWYSVKAQLDEPLSALLRKGRLAAGGKLIIHGTQLVGSQEACAPLEAPQSLMLKIFANSSRPARWDTKLGFYKDPRPFLLSLSSLFSNGGPVGCVDIVVLRSYPVQWMERKSDGGVVFRLARAEEEEEARHNGLKQKAMEVLYAKIQAEFEQEDIESKRQLRRRTVSHRDIGSLQDGQELYEAVGDDLAGLEALLSEQQLETLRAYSRSLMDKKRAEMQDRYRRATEENTDGGQASCPQRDVTPVWKLCVADSLNPTGHVYQLNLWRPSSDVQALLKEGCRYKVYNLATSDRKKRGAVGALQLTATKKTQFQDLQASAEWLSACFQPRVSTDFVALQNLEFDPPCGEVDLTGCVVSVLDGKGPSPAFYLVDGNVNFVKVLCFSSLLQAGLADVVKPGALLALSNLQLRGRSTRPTPVVYAGDLTVFSTKPKEEHLQKALGRLRDLLQEQEKFFVCAEDKLSQVLKRDVCSPALPPKTPPTQHVWTNTTSQQPVRSLGSFTPPSRNLQPAADTSLSEKDPRSLKRRRAVDYLSRVPSPPPLFLPPGLAASPFVKKTFNPPRRASTPRTLKTVHTPNLVPVSASPPDEKEEEAWVNDHELAMIDTQALRSNEAR
ncbi:LOW QUALITY PROTEIN: breast cancer type 2 susceptibility protein [Hippocampus comes]|uniref:LOW QUALITY PROTEIN: breast cancer type 2 susceptibility protein n=1 Tax=Hippocampus comes TaxID=109280 RepID=UPI00094E630B|nr:PREDICTED: LOW QUALITY PROTEIN: breast cancer type 2 susceptibility protein [Hippocampus comes]